jgi:hypothetical protein
MAAPPAAHGRGRLGQGRDDAHEGDDQADGDHHVGPPFQGAGRGVGEVEGVGGVDRGGQATVVGRRQLAAIVRPAQLEDRMGHAAQALVDRLEGLGERLLAIAAQVVQQVGATAQVVAQRRVFEMAGLEDQADGEDQDGRRHHQAAPGMLNTATTNDVTGSCI